MKTEELEAMLDAAERLAEEGCANCHEALQRWQRGDYVGFAARMRDGIKNLALATVLLEALATECDRLKKG